MKTEYVAIEDAKDKWVKLINISEEPPAFGRITSIRDQGIIIQFHVSEHPTCGGFTWEYPRGTMLELRPPIRRK